MVGGSRQAADSDGVMEQEPVLVLGGPDGDTILRARLANSGGRVDGPALIQALLDEEAEATRR